MYNQSGLNEKKKKLIEELQKINDKFEADKAEIKKNEETFERKTYDEPTADELYKIAKESVEKKYGKIISAAKEETDEKTDAIGKKIKDTQENKEKAVKEIDDEYKTAKDKIGADTVKNGIQHSSIAGELGKELEKSVAADKETVEKNTDKKVVELKAAIEKLNAELKKLTEESKVQQIDEEKTNFETLQNESDKKKEDVRRYNKQVESDEAAYKNTDEYKANQEKIAKIQKESQVDKLDLILDYYLSFDDKAAALKEFGENSDLKEQLGDYYNYALRVLTNRANAR